MSEVTYCLAVLKDTMFFLVDCLLCFFLLVTKPGAMVRPIVPDTWEVMFE